MKKSFPPLALTLPLLLLTACIGRQASASSLNAPTGVATALPATVQPATATPIPSLTATLPPATALPATALPVPSYAATLPRTTLVPVSARTPTFDPTSWQSLPVVPVASQAARQIYAAGQQMGNDPHAFSIIGDCLSLPINLFGNYGKGPNHYNLGDYTSLQPAIDWFKDSFNRQSVTLADGFNTAAILSPLRADPEQCQSTETPLACEFRLHQPSFIFISLGTDDYQTPPETFESRLRQMVEYAISHGTVPILATKADDREGGYAFNIIIARLANEYDVPLWNFWAAVQDLPNGGLTGEDGHLSWADPNRLDETYSLQVAVPVRDLTALQTLDSVWRGVTGE